MTSPSTCGLLDLLGTHLLSAVGGDGDPHLAADGITRPVSGDGAIGQVFAFILDGVRYVATEDALDGYRSALRDIAIFPGGKLQNGFGPVKVEIARGSTVGWDDPDDEFDDGEFQGYLTFLCPWTKTVILKIGTMYYDPHYPSFVAAWYPENMTEAIVRTQTELLQAKTRGLGGAPAGRSFL